MLRQNRYHSFRQLCAALLGLLIALSGLMATPGYLRLPVTEAGTAACAILSQPTRAPQETAPASRTQAAPAQGNLSTLTAGKTIERQMAVGETHDFRVALAIGQYLQVTADQHGIDVALRALHLPEQGLRVG